MMKMNCVHFPQWTSYPGMSNYRHQQFEEISKKSLRAMFRDRNSKNSVILLERISFSKKWGMLVTTVIASVYFKLLWI